MARRKTRVKDKWREKKWVTVVAPDSFNNVPIAYIPITDEENAKGRVVEVTLFDILKGDPSQHQYKMYFQVDKVEGDKAITIFKRYEYAKEFLRSLIRRGSSKINYVFEVKTKDGYIFPNQGFGIDSQTTQYLKKARLKINRKRCHGKNNSSNDNRPVCPGNMLW